MKKRLIVAGSRKFEDYELLRRSVDEFLARHPGPVEIVSGKAKGADTLGERYADDRELHVEPFPAGWKEDVPPGMTYNPSAGPIRNRQMAEYATHLIAFWDGNKQRSGTWNMICTARKLGLYVEIVMIAQPRKSPQREIF